MESRDPAPSRALGRNGRGPQAKGGMWIARGPMFRGLVIGRMSQVEGRLVPLGELAGRAVAE